MQKLKSKILASDGKKYYWCNTAEECLFLRKYGDDTHEWYIEGEDFVGERADDGFIQQCFIDQIPKAYPGWFTLRFTKTYGDGWDAEHRYLRSAVDEINRAEEQLADIQDKLIELKNL